MKEFNELLKKLNISRREFAEMIGMKYKSMGAVLVEGKPVPKWAKAALIIYKKTNEKIQNHNKGI